MKEFDNGKTLAELRFKRNEQLTANRKNIFNSVRLPLMNPDNESITDRAKFIFSSWFYQFAEPVDPLDVNSR